MRLAAIKVTEIENLNKQRVNEKIKVKKKN